MTLHQARFSPVNDDDGMPPFRADYLRRYFADPVFRSAVDAVREREQERHHVELDRQILANFKAENFDEEPGFVSVLRERIAAFDEGDRS
jgi:hypothetical protein